MIAEENMAKYIRTKDNLINCNDKDFFIEKNIEKEVFMIYATKAVGSIEIGVYKTKQEANHILTKIENFLICTNLKVLDLNE